jgi:superfamily II DNA/RNA helicase
VKTKNTNEVVLPSLTIAYVSCQQEYIHRVGRTARGVDGSGHALLFLLPEELAFLRYLKHAKVSSIRIVVGFKMIKHRS